jgi:hypothetical protein
MEKVSSPSALQGFSFMHHTLCSILFLPALLALVFLSTDPAQGSQYSDTSELRSWITEMKDADRGPFQRIRWFCADGTVHPPKPYPCAERGGGVQHAQWSKRTEELRQNGYYIANFLAAVKASTFVANDERRAELEQMIVERWFIRADHGWIMRKARWYRGAFQAEDEDEGGRLLLTELLQDENYRRGRFPLVMEAVRLLPHGVETAPIIEMRDLATAVANKDKAFTPIRVKLHGNPDAGDRELIRKYVAEKGKLSEDLAELIDKLTASLDKIYTPPNAAEPVLRIAEASKNVETSVLLRNLASLLADDRAPLLRIRAACRIMETIRSELTSFGPKHVLDAADSILALEQFLYAMREPFLEHLRRVSRREHLTLIDDLSAALYGGGLLSDREYDAVQRTVAELIDAKPSAELYAAGVERLSRLPEWCERTLRLHFGPAVKRFTQLDPKAERFFQDRLRSGTLLLTASVLDVLSKDADTLAGVSHEIFGKKAVGGVSGLNAGLTRGALQVYNPDRPVSSIDPKAVAVLPEALDNVPPVAGIITGGRGNVLSHVSLLAGNLGIPNAAFSRDVLARIKGFDGRPVVMAVSPRGSVVLAEDGPKWRPFFKQKAQKPTDLIVPDMDKINLAETRLLRLMDVGAADSGRTCGPKAANLGELKNAFPGTVSSGLVIPFGVFNEILERPMDEGKPKLIDYMRARYAALGKIRSSDERRRMTSAFLAEMRDYFENIELGPRMERRMRTALADVFGRDGSYGVFVRSDTNIEDLPNFTGAGLNLTVPNVVGADNIIAAVKRVWASPFSERAFGWRQSYMKNPDQVFASVLIQKSVPADISGVMVTADVDGNRPGYITVAVNRGVGGAVLGQSAEELLIRTSDAHATLLASAAEPIQRVILPEGGLAKVRVKGGGPLLDTAMIAKLTELAQTAPQFFPSLKDAEGKTVPADIEFGFANGKLALFQIRPFIESVLVRRSLFLTSLDENLKAAAGTIVELDAAPPYSP